METKIIHCFLLFKTDDGERVRSLLVGGGQGGGVGGGQEEQQDLLLRLEDAISRGDHRLVLKKCCI